VYDLTARYPSRTSSEVPKYAMKMMLNTGIVHQAHSTWVYPRFDDCKAVKWTTWMSKNCSWTLEKDVQGFNVEAMLAIEKTKSAARMQKVVKQAIARRRKDDMVRRERDSRCSENVGV
jgi:hypothetical protein